MSATATPPLTVEAVHALLAALARDAAAPVTPLGEVVFQVVDALNDLLDAETGAECDFDDALRTLDARLDYLRIEIAVVREGRQP